MTRGAPCERTYSRAASASSKTSNAGVGAPAARMMPLANDLLPSMRAAACVGPKMRSPSRWKRSTMPRVSGSSGPTMVRSMPCSQAAATSTSKSVTAMGRSVAMDAVPALPGAANSSGLRGLWASFHRMACSRRAAPNDESFTPVPRLPQHDQRDPQADDADAHRMKTVGTSHSPAMPSAKPPMMNVMPNAPNTVRTARLRLTMLIEAIPTRWCRAACS